MTRRLTVDAAWLSTHLAIGGMFLSVFVAIPVGPVMVERAGGGALAAGVVTGAFALSTVIAQALLPLRPRGWGPRALAVVTAALGAANLGFVLAPDSISIMTVASVVRGLAFGVCSVLASLIVLELGDAARRAELLASYGVAVSIPGIFGASLGLGVAEASPRAAMTIALVIGIAAGVAALGSRPVPADRFAGRSIRSTTAVVFSAPIAIHLSATIGYGVFVTFGPLAFAAPAIVFLVMGMTRALGRWLSGRLAGVWTTPTAIRLSAVVLVTGATLLITVGDFAPVGAALYGLAMGVLTNAVLVRMLEVSTDEDRGLVSAAWNASIDGGVGIGALAIGAAFAGRPAADTLTLIPVLAAAGAALAFVALHRPIAAPGPQR